MQGRFKRLLPIAVLIVILGGAGVAWLKRWEIHDFLRLRGYNPPARVVQLANDTTMNEGSSRLFYVYHPSLEDKASFSNHCSNAEVTIVLGCYNPRTGIFISDITDPRLEGILQVTSAHEMLHAAYDRLPGSEKERINGLLDQAFAQLDNQRIKETINEYQKQGADISNELHCAY